MRTLKLTTTIIKSPSIIADYVNGNAHVVLYDNGTREITFPKGEELLPASPLNIDIRVSSRCAFGAKPDGRPGVCSFCHESATVDGTECDYDALLTKLKGVPAGTELAVGCNEFTSGLLSFLKEASEVHGFVVNLTINQGHLKRDKDRVQQAIDNNLIKGLGISYRSFLDFEATVPVPFLNYKNTVVHTICGIDTVDNVLSLLDKGVKKILILGEKNFGFNKGLVNTDSSVHQEWRKRIKEVLTAGFQYVSFDNLGLEQLNIRSVLDNEQLWARFYQYERSMYINAVSGYFSPSSRSEIKTPWDSKPLKDFFQQEVLIRSSEP